MGITLAIKPSHYPTHYQVGRVSWQGGRNADGLTGSVLLVLSVCSRCGLILPAGAADFALGNLRIMPIVAPPAVRVRSFGSVGAETSSTEPSL
jgi:hypothetical protein